MTRRKFRNLPTTNINVWTEVQTFMFLVVTGDVYSMKTHSEAQKSTARFEKIANITFYCFQSYRDQFIMKYIL